MSPHLRPERLKRYPQGGCGREKQSCMPLMRICMTLVRTCGTLPRTCRGLMQVRFRQVRIPAGPLHTCMAPLRICARLPRTCTGQSPIRATLLRMAGGGLRTCTGVMRIRRPRLRIGGTLMRISLSRAEIPAPQGKFARARTNPHAPPGNLHPPAADGRQPSASRVGRRVLCATVAHTPVDPASTGSPPGKLPMGGIQGPFGVCRSVAVPCMWDLGARVSVPGSRRSADGVSLSVHP